jgi:serine/threonine protein kinase
MMGCAISESADPAFGSAVVPLDPDGKVQENQDPASVTLRMQESDLEMILNSISTGVKPWQTGQFTFIKTLQNAVRNHGHVDLMESVAPDLPGGVARVAVKKMPTKWVQKSAHDFNAKYPNSSERPWYDMAFVKALRSLDCPFVCELVGIFRDEKNTYVVTQLCTEGDLFGWCDFEPGPGSAREAITQPLVKQICFAIKFIHSVGIAHRDLSLENILLTKSSGDQLQVKLIDFGMGSLGRFYLNEVRGKQSYQAPEMHSATVAYDAFLTDMFAIGVVIFGMSVRDYPWISTRRNGCKLFEFYHQNGLPTLLKKRKLRGSAAQYLADVLSEPLADLLAALLQMDPSKRVTCGAQCFQEAGASRPSACDMKWLSSVSVLR